MTYLNCANNYIQDLTVSALTKLESLRCSNNKLRTLTFGSNVQYVYCDNNQLAGQRSYQNMTNLKWLDISNNQVTYLSFKNCSSIFFVACPLSVA